MVRSAASSRARQELAVRLAELFPELKRRFQADLPPALSEELAHATAHQLEVVCHLSNTDGLTMHDLARTQHCAMSTATALADRLVQHGLAERIDDPADRRVVRIQPTDKARDLAGQFRQARRETLLNILAPLSDEDLATLVRLLSVLVGAEEPIHA